MELLNHILGMEGFEGLLVWLSGLTAFFAIYTVGNSVVERDYLGPRLHQLQRRRSQLKQQYLGEFDQQEDEGLMVLVRQVVEQFNLLPKDRIAALRDFMASAGYRNKDALMVYVFARLVCPIGAVILTIVMLKINIFSAEILGMPLLYIGLAAYLGLKLPDLMVHNLRNKRWHKIRMGLPDAIDLMMVCAEAGLTLPAAMERVAKEVGLAHPELADEMALTSVEIGFLPERKTALQNFQNRVDIAEVRGMVSVLLQTEKYGTPVAQALRVLSKEMRMQRFLRAEQKAARLPALMTIPMISCILPTLFIVIMVPAIIQMIDEWK